MERVRGKPVEGVSDGEVLGLIRQMKDAVEGGKQETAQSDAGYLLTSINGKPSREAKIEQVKAPEQALVEKSFKELGALSDEYQTRIDRLHDELDASGIPFKDQLERPEVKAAYDERIKYDTAAAQKGYSGSKQIIERILAGMPFKTTFASVDSILRERYSLTDNPNTGVYMMAKYTGGALENSKTITEVAKDIEKLIVARDYPNADYHALMESNMSALTTQGRSKILKESAEKAKKIQDELI